MPTSINTGRAVRRLLLLFVALLVAGLPAQGQSVPRGVPSLGMGGGGPAFVRDNNAIFFNPANLVYNERGNRVVISILPVRLVTGGDLAQFGYYSQAFEGGALSDADKAEILDGWFGDASANELRRAGVLGDVVPLAVTYRGSENWAVGLALRLRSYSRLGLNRGLIDLALFGTDTNRSVPIDGAIRSMNSTNVQVAFSYRMPEQRLSFGIAPKLVLGHSYGDATMNSTLTISEDAYVHQFDYTVEAAGSFSRDVLDQIDLFDLDSFDNASVSNPIGEVAGTGVGVDLGVTYQATNNLDVSAALTDLGTVSWSTDARTLTPRTNTFRFEGFELDLDRLNDEFDGNLQDYFTNKLDSLAENSYGDTQSVEGSFSTSLPAAVHLGGTLRGLNNKARLNFGGSIPLNEAPGNMNGEPAVYAGVEYRIGGRFAMPVRFGVRALGIGAASVAFGFGIHTPVYDFDFGIAVTPDTGVGGEGARYTFGLSLLNIRL